MSTKGDAMQMYFWGTPPEGESSCSGADYVSGGNALKDFVSMLIAHRRKIIIFWGYLFCMWGVYYCQENQLFAETDFIVLSPGKMCLMFTSFLLYVKFTIFYYKKFHDSRRFMDKIGIYFLFFALICFCAGCVFAAFSQLHLLEPIIRWVGFGIAGIVFFSICVPMIICSLVGLCISVKDFFV